MDGQNYDSQDRPRICLRGKNCCRPYNLGFVTKAEKMTKMILLRDGAKKTFVNCMLRQSVHHGEE